MVSVKNMKIVILDQEDKNMEQILVSLIESNHEKNVIRFTSVFAFVTYIYDERKGDVDLLYIYVADAEDENILAAQDIQNYFPHIRLIFFSENTDCAESIFQAVPSYFLKLPADSGKVKASLDRVRNELKEEVCRTITLTVKGEIHRIRYSAIHYVESEGRRLNIYTTDNVYEINMTIENMIAKLPEHFVRCHRSYIVNLDKIVRYPGDMVELSGGEHIPVARARQKTVWELLNKYNKPDITKKGESYVSDTGKRTKNF